MGGGLVRSFGGWEEARRSAREVPMKGDERILRGTSFVLDLLERVEERMSSLFCGNILCIYMRKWGQIAIEGVQQYQNC